MTGEVTVHGAGGACVATLAVWSPSVGDLSYIFLNTLKRRKRGTHAQRGPTIINNLCLCMYVYQNVQAHVVRYRPSS